MSRYIDADKLENVIGLLNATDYGSCSDWKMHSGASEMKKDVLSEISEMPTVDAVEVVRCKNCIWYHKAHVECNDGTEKDESEFPDEAFGILGRKCGVTIAYGINVGGACENKRLFINDKYQFRNPDGYCSYGEREDGAE